MSQSDLSTKFQDATLQVRQASSQALDLSQRATSNHMQLIKDQAEANFGLARSVLDIRDMEGLKSFWFEALRVSREGFERLAQNSQEVVASQAELTQKVGRQMKERVQASAK